jgi:predicted GIY-YIG superfamily endonuclease
VLYLEDDRYYVGITTNFVNRVRQHGGPYGAQWTKRHSPLEVVELHDLGTITNYEAERIEQDFFEQYRKEYGVSNVRGGRIVSTGNIYRIHKFYFNQSMLEASGVVALLLICGLVLMVENL